MKTSSRFLRFHLLGAVMLSFCLSAPLHAEEKPAPEVPMKTLTPEEQTRLDDLDIGFEKAYELRRAERHDEAMKQFREALANLEKLVGPEDGRTLKRRADLAEMLSGQKIYGAVVAEYRAIISVRNRLLGPEDSVAMWLRYNMAHLLEAQEKLAEAEQEFRAVLPQMDRMPMPGGGYIQSAHRDLAELLEKQGRKADAEKEYRASVAIMRRHRGPENEEVLSERLLLAEKLELFSKAADAEKEYRAVVAIQDRVFGINGQSTFHCRLSLAECLERRGKLKEALTIIKRTDVDARKAGWPYINGPGIPLERGPMAYPGEPRLLEDRKRINAKLEEQRAGGK